jgi:hypothetical protein
MDFGPPHQIAMIMAAALALATIAAPPQKRQALPDPLTTVASRTAVGDSARAMSEQPPAPCGVFTGTADTVTVRNILRSTRNVISSGDAFGWDTLGIPVDEVPKVVVQDTVLCRKAINLIAAKVQERFAISSLRLVRLQHAYLARLIWDPAPGPDFTIYYVLDLKLERLLDPKCPGAAMCKP